MILERFGVGPGTLKDAHSVFLLCWIEYVKVNICLALTSRIFSVWFLSFCMPYIFITTKKNWHQTKGFLKTFSDLYLRIHKRLNISLKHVSIISHLSQRGLFPAERQK